MIKKNSAQYQLSGVFFLQFSLVQSNLLINNLAAL